MSSCTPLATREAFTLHVNGIPANLEKSGLENVFAKYGQVVDVYLHKKNLTHGKMWGRVTMDSRSSAMAAMADLNLKNPLRLTVRVFVNDDERSKKDEDREEFRKARGISKDDEQAVVENGNDNASVSSSVFTFGNRLLLPATTPGTCHFCKGEGKVRCSVCKAWYCSQACQEEDWIGTHAMVCSPIPALEHPNGGKVLKSSDEIRSPLKSEEPEQIKQTAMKAEQKVKKPIRAPAKAESVKMGTKVKPAEEKPKEKEVSEPKGKTTEKSEEAKGIKYDKTHLAEFPIDATKLQAAYYLNAESPTAVFLTPATLSESIQDLDATIREHVNKKAKEVSPEWFAPMGHMCLAKASDDIWYRACPVGDIKDLKGEVYFPDYGFKEVVDTVNMLPIPEELLVKPFAANHCILDGFEKVEIGPELMTEAFDYLVREMPTQLAVYVLKRLDGGIKIVQIPELTDGLNELIKKHGGGKASEDDTKKSAAKEQLRKEMEALEAKLKALES